MPTLQLKLTAALAALIVFVSMISGFLAERGLRERETARVERSLAERLALVDELTSDFNYSTSEKSAMGALARRAAQAAAARVTLIAKNGAVVGDSEVPFDRLASVENHADRPEVRTALTGKIGKDSRSSDTVGRRLLYLAAPHGAGDGVTRLAVDLSHLENDVRALRLELVAATLVGLAAAVGLSFLLAGWALRPLNEVRLVTASIAEGDLEPRLPLRGSDEIGEISGAINRMAEQMRQQLDETTAEKEQLHAILNAMVEGVLVVDAEGTLLLANDRLRELFDAWGDLRGRTPLEVVRSADFEQLLADAARTDDPVACEIQIGGAGSRDLRVQAVRFPAGEQTRIGTVAVFHDLTEIHRLEQVRQDFVANASHELRTPLAAVRGFAETLLHSELSADDQHSYLGIIERHALRLEHIVDDLLVLSRAESGAASLKLGEVDLTSVVRSLISDANRRPAAAELEIHLRNDAPTVAWADRQAVEHVLSNLLDNAIKYTEAGGRIDVSIEESDTHLRTRVTDTGLGIPDEDLSRIFERFYRVDKARSRELGGTGLGLSIVRHLVQRMGGEISVESEFGKGSTFAFTLPKRPPGTTST